MYREGLLLLALVSAISATTPKLPQNLRRCSRSLHQGAWNECLKYAIEDGFSKLKNGDETINIEPFDPLRIEQIVTTKNGVLISLDVNQKDAVVRGFGEGIKIDRTDFNFEKGTFSGSLQVPKLILESFQVLKGKIVGIPLVWKGDMICNITRPRCDFNAPFESLQKNGKEFLQFNADRIKLHLDVEHVNVRHKEGSPAERGVAAAADALINSNWRLVFGVLRPSYEDIFRKQLGKSLIGLFSTVPVEEIFLK